jgi:hypothetical protein
MKSHELVVMNSASSLLTGEMPEPHKQTTQVAKPQAEPHSTEH